MMIETTDGPLCMVCFSPPDICMMNRKWEEEWATWFRRAMAACAKKIDADIMALLAE